MKKKPLQIAVFFSGSADMAQYLIRNDKNYGSNYEFVFVLCNNVNAAGIQFFQKRKKKSINFNVLGIGDPTKMPYYEKRNYYEGVSNLIGSLKLDLIISDEFNMEIISGSLGNVPVVAVHPADLNVFSEKQSKKKNSLSKISGIPERKYKSSDAVRLALNAGEKQTFSTAYVASSNMDKAKIICKSDPLKVDPGVTPNVHSEKMKIHCSGPVLSKALAMIAKEEFVLN